jgi:streptomycin 6-kinase
MTERLGSALVLSGLDGFIERTRARLGAEAEPWLSRVAALVDELTARWELRPGIPFGGDSIGYTVPATRSGREAVVLRISYPDGWFAQETAALAAWGGDGAVELIDHDPRGAQLLDRAIPGTSLSEDDDEDRAMGLAADVLERLWIPEPGGVDRVEVETEAWATSMMARHHLVGRPFDRELVTEAIRLLRSLASSQPEHVLLHGDLHLGNVVKAERQPWLAVDPKPLVGERAFDVTALIRDKVEEVLAEPDGGKGRVQHRFDLLSERFGLDRERLRDWSFAIVLDYTIWDYEVGDKAFAEQQLAMARLLKDLAI